MLKNFGKTVLHVGEKPGLAQIAKLANNLLAAAAMVVSSEALAMGVKAGLDAKVLIDIINAGSGRNSATQDKFPRSILTGTFDFGFATGLSYKDVRLCVDEAEAMGVPMVAGAAVRQMLAVTQAKFGADVGLHLHREGRRRMGGGGDQVERRRTAGREGLHDLSELHVTTSDAQTSTSRRTHHGQSDVRQGSGDPQVGARRGVRGEVVQARPTTSIGRCRSWSPSTAGARCGAARGCDKKTRSLLNLAMISALNRPHELKMHIAGALRTA